MMINANNDEWIDAFDLAKRIYNHQNAVKGEELDQLDIILAARNSTLIRYDPFKDTYAFVDQAVEFNNPQPTRLRGIADIDITPIKLSTMDIMRSAPVYIKGTPICVVPPSTILIYNHSFKRIYKEKHDDKGQLKKASERDMRPGAEMIYKHKGTRLFRVFVLKEVTKMEELAAENADERSVRRYKMLFVDLCKIHVMKLHHFYLPLIGRSIEDIPCSIIACRMIGIDSVGRDFIAEYDEQTYSLQKMKENNRLDVLVYAVDDYEKKVIVDYPSLTGCGITESRHIELTNSYKRLNLKDPARLELRDIEERLHPRNRDRKNRIELQSPVASPVELRIETPLFSVRSSPSIFYPVMDSPQKFPKCHQQTESVDRQIRESSAADYGHSSSQQAITNKIVAKTASYDHKLNSESVESRKSDRYYPTGTPRKNAGVRQRTPVDMNKFFDKSDQGNEPSSCEEDNKEAPKDICQQSNDSNNHTPIKPPILENLKEQHKEVTVIKAEQPAAARRLYPYNRIPACEFSDPDSEDDWVDDSEIDRDTALSHHMKVPVKIVEIEEVPKADVGKLVQQKKMAEKEAAAAAAAPRRMAFGEPPFARTLTAPKTNGTYIFGQKDMEKAFKILNGGKKEEKVIDKVEITEIVELKVIQKAPVVVDDDEDAYLSDFSLPPPVVPLHRDIHIAKEADVVCLGGESTDSIVNITPSKELSDLEKKDQHVEIARDDQPISSDESVDGNEIPKISEDARQMAYDLRRRLIEALDANDRMHFLGYQGTILGISEVSANRQFWEDELKWSKALESKFNN